jgi:polar amino acid transport system substrate-binding protein
MRSSLVEPRRADRWTAPAMLLLLLAAVSLVVSAQAAPLDLVSTAWPPFANAPGQPRFALDLVEAALGRIGLGAKTTIVDAGQFTPSLLTGRFDGSAAVWKDPERERVLLFSQPYLENRLVLVGRRGGDVSAKSLAQREPGGTAIQRMAASPKARRSRARFLTTSVVDPALLSV